MILSTLIHTLSNVIDSTRSFLAPIPGALLLCTCSRRPGFSSILTSAKVYADMNQNENDEIVKRFVYNVIDKIKMNIQDDGVCLIAIPPGALRFNLIGANAMGPIVLNEDPKDSNETPSNRNFTFMWGIIR